MPVDLKRNKRLLLNVDHALALRIECLADMDRRSMSNWILGLVEERIQDLSDKDHEEMEDRFYEKLDKLPLAKAELVIQQEKERNKDALDMLKSKHPEVYAAFMKGQEG